MLGIVARVHSFQATAALVAAARKERTVECAPSSKSATSASRPEQRP